MGRTLIGEASALLLTRFRPESVAERGSLVPNSLFLLGAAALVIPTLIGVARFSWTTDQGGHGPLVLATGIWLLVRESRRATAPRSEPNLLVASMAILFCLLTYGLARITGILEIEAFAMYGALVGALYLLWGGPLLRAIWFPLLYLAFTLPPPDTVVAAVTQPIKIWISTFAVDLLHALGYPIASSGVMIQIAQYELLVAAACAGLNSILSLTAICFLYSYLRHGSKFYPFLIICVFVIPIAILSNFIRVLFLILITYYLGESAAQGFLHDFAGLLMFSVALAGAFLVDWVYTQVSRRRRST